MQIDYKTALMAVARMGIATELEFIKQATKAGPLFQVMMAARRDAITALGQLPHIDPAKTEDLRKLQNEVQRFADLVAYVKRILEGSDEAIKLLRSEEAEELRDLVLNDDQPGED
jgi:hypothetical protein